MKKDTSSQTPDEKKSEDLPPFDLYAAAALTGLLANPTIMASLGLQNYLQGKENVVQEQIVGAAFRYAEIAIELRKTILHNVNVDATADEKTN